MAKLSRRRAETVSFWGIFVHLVLGLLTLAVARWSGSLACTMAGWQILAGVPVWVLCLLLLRQKRLAEDEAADWQRLMEERRNAGGSGALFEVEEGEAFLQRHRLEGMEKYFMPAGSLLMFVVMGLTAYLVFRLRVDGKNLLDIERALVPANMLMATCFIGVMALLTFLIGMFAAGMAREKVWRDLRPGASYMMFGSVGLVLAAGAFVFAWAHFYVFDLIFAWALNIAFGVIAVETLLSYVVNRYRPRTPGSEVRFAFDSRLMQMVTSPGSILHTAASTLDYQFGFKVSDTWFYRFMERMIAPIVLFDMVTLYVLSCFVIVYPGEKMIVERFGNPVVKTGELRVLGPGLHTKAPWPIDRGYRVSVAEVRSIHVGHTGEIEPGSPMLWTKQHFKEEHLVLVATDIKDDERDRAEDAPPPVNLLASAIVIHYRVKDGDDALRDYVYRVQNAEDVLQSLSYREATKYLASVDFYDVMCIGRANVGAELKARIQAASDREKLGIDILFVGISGVHPPVEEGVGESFEAVVASQQQKKADILAAEGDAIRTVKLAEYSSRSLLTQAKGEREKRALDAKARAVRFENQYKLDQIAGDLYRDRLFYEALEDALANVRKYVIAAKAWDSEVYELNLEEARKVGLLDVGKIEDESTEAGQTQE